MSSWSSVLLLLTAFSVTTVHCGLSYREVYDEPHKQKGFLDPTGPKSTDAAGRTMLKYLQKEPPCREDDGSLCPPLCPCPPCNPNKCHLPDCKCSNFTIPGKIPRQQTPQMVVVTTQAAVTNHTYTAFLSLFDGLRNPNNCSATGTYFVSHEFTDYFYVQSLRSKGHEIGDNSVTGGNSTDYWKSATERTWLKEIQDQATMLRLYANVTDVRGFRTPYLQPGGDNQLKAMKASKSTIAYDSTRASVRYSRGSSSGGLLWPYTHDYQSTQDCVVQPCPTKCYPGVWEFPLLAFWDRFNHSCALLDGCDTVTYHDVFLLLHDRFSDHYDGNRAPLLISLSASWLTTEFQFKGLRLFLEYLAGYDDVFIVSSGQAMDWIRNPTPMSKIDTLKPWRCDQPPPPVCSESVLTPCRYYENRTQGGSYYTLRSCAISSQSQCPKCYPWLGDTLGKTCKIQEIFKIRRDPTVESEVKNKEESD